MKGGVTEQDTERKLGVKTERGEGREKASRRGRGESYREKVGRDRENE